MALERKLTGGLVVARTIARAVARVVGVLGLASLLARSAPGAEPPPVPPPSSAPVRLEPIEVEAPREQAQAEAEAPGFLTVVVPERPSARIASVAELVQREAGLRVRSAGGLGAFSAVSIRGSDAAEVAVFLDGVLLNRAAGGAVDLAQIPVDGLERVEIYRGMVPAELGGQAIGGAINLVTRRGARGRALRLSVGGGSFGTRSLGAGYGFGGRGLHGDASASYRGSRGDFIYYDDNGTILNPADDHAAARRNNDFDQGAADVAIGGDGGRLRWSLGAHGFLKEQGVALRAGGTDRLRPSARASTGRLLLDGAVERTGFPDAAVDLRLATHLLVQRNAFSNPAADPIGFGVSERSDALALEGGFEGRLRATGRFHLFTVLLSGSLEHYAPTDLAGSRRRAPAASDRRRLALAVVDELRLAADRLVLVPSVRFEAVDNQVAAEPTSIGPGAKGSDAAGQWLSPQIAVRLRATGWLAFKGSFGRALRLPTLFELFGDRAFVLPHPSLRPESAIGGDAGATVDLHRGPLGLALEGAFFGRVVDDYIALLASGFASAYENVGAARVLGAEARARLRLGAFASLSGDYTFIHGESDAGDAFAGSRGKPLPGVPAHKLDARADLALGPFAVYYEVSFVGEVYLTAHGDAGLALPARTLHALGFKAGPFPSLPLTLAIEVANLGDLRVVDIPVGGVVRADVPHPLSDYRDYPLPGRAVYVTLSYQPRTQGR